MKKVTAYIGCDPGASGALCILKVPDNAPVEIFFLDHKKATPKERIEWLNQATKELNVRMAILEDVKSLLGMSAKSNFTFGGEFHNAKLILELQEFGFDLVKPKAWQKEVGVPAKKPKVKRTTAELKKLIADTAKRIYPKAEINGPKGGLLDGRSDALMIAHYCMLKYK